MNCPTCKTPIPEADVLKEFSAIMSARSAASGKAGRPRTLPDCPHCGKRFRTRSLVLSHRCPKLGGKHPPKLDGLLKTSPRSPGR
jgi:hypothetical protein